MLRTRKNAKIIGILAIIALAPGGLTLLYSQTFIHIGIGATDWWWGYPSFNSDVSLSVSNSTPIATETLYGEQLTIREFNITGGNVSIVVSCETNGTIATYVSITGEHGVYLTYPSVDPTSNHRQDFNVTVFWIDSNATITFDYSFNMAMHGDGSVTRISQGYEEIRALGEFLLIGGLVMTGILVMLGLIAIGFITQRTDSP